MTDEEVEAAIDAFVATAPPLSDEQRVRLAVLLRPMREALTAELEAEFRDTAKLTQADVALAGGAR